MTPSAAIAQPPRMRHVARQELLRHIGGLAVGDRLPSLDELSNDLGIGRNNLQAAMRELAGEGVVVSRPRLGTYVARRPAQSRRPSAAGRGVDAPHLGARALAGKRIAMMTHDFTDPLLSQMLRAATAAFEGTGAILLEQTLRQLPDGRVELPDGCDLAINFNPPLPQDRAFICTTPTIVVSTAWHESLVPAMTCDLVGVDQVGGAVMAGRLLRESGFDEACFLGVRKRDESGAYGPVSALRLQGFETGFGRALEPAHKLVGIGYSLNGGSSAFRRYMELRHRPKAVFAACDEMAIGFILAAEAHGLLPARDFHIVGFDGHRLGRQLAGGSLTTIDAPLQAMGQLAVDVTVRRLLRPTLPRQITCLACRLHRGHTVAASSSFIQKESL